MYFPMNFFVFIKINIENQQLYDCNCYELETKQSVSKNI